MRAQSNLVLLHLPRAALINIHALCLAHIRRDPEMLNDRHADGGSANRVTA